MTVPFLNSIIWQEERRTKNQSRKGPSESLVLSETVETFQFKSAPFPPSPRQTIWRGLG
ncbi:hypothetical protein [Bacillus sp. BA3]|uniref:hypothetical protein n=1 Tax=Bacillus sp. BA3 TaxID=2057910 RepID=UPI0012FF1826|nr:hypothetical protein [Bacillus sp. BA3]